MIKGENIKNHEENVRRSNEIANVIRHKVTDLIEKIKKEEAKLLVNVQEFSNAEQRLEMINKRFVKMNVNIRRLIDEKTVRLQDLSTINKFCLASQEKLLR